MADHQPPGITSDQFARLADHYRREWPVRMAAVLPDGRRRFARGWWRGPDPVARRELVALVVSEGLRWGEPTIMYGEGGDMFWAAPLMYNAELRGGVVAAIHEDVLFPDNTNQPIVDLRRGATELRLLAERANLTNAALLEARRWQYAREQERAEMLHGFKADSPLRVRQLYLQEEPELMAAVRRADRPAARAVLNRILTVLLSAAGERFGLVRSFLVELVATMNRTAVEAGGDTEQLLGDEHRGLTRLAEAETMEALAPCLHDVLDRMIDTLEHRRDSMQSVLIANAVQTMRQSLHEELSRDGLAEAMCLSPSHFSRLFREHTGRTFTDALMQMRVDRAAELLARTDLSLAQIAERCGFGDASYFGKVFRRRHGQSPGQYRLTHGGELAE